MCKVVNDNIILKIEDVTYCYEGEKLPVWRHLSCCFYDGKIHAICGPSGCGKSSILYLIDGLIPHMYEGSLEGKIYLENEEVTDILPRNRCDKIGFVMQNPESQFITFTVEEELAFGLENLGVEPEIIEKRIKEVLDLVGMQGYEKVDLNQLSGGQKQKVAIASIIITKPKILLLDEPTANLDPDSRREIFDLIIKLSREEKITIILVEHNITEIIDDVDYIIALSADRKIIIQGETRNYRQEIDKIIHPKYEPGVIICNQSEETVIEISGLEYAYPQTGIRKSFNKKEKKVINGLDLRVNKQDFFAIIGENGAGKTTLLKLIFGICDKNKGEIKILGKSLEKYRKKELYKLIGLVFQNPENQFITNTVWDEMMFSLKNVKMSNEDKEKKVEGMLRKFHLEGEKEKSPFVLSQGQKRRLSVASMLLTGQKLLFLDEPTYGQDHENRQELMNDMQELINAGVTIVMITHDIELIKCYATKVAKLEEGRIKTCLPVAEYFK